MLNSFYLFLIPFLGAVLYLSYKYFSNRKKIDKIVNSAFLDEGINNNLDATRENIFSFFDTVRNLYTKTISVSLYWVLHYIVIFLKFISDLTDVLYSKVRDFFLKTATKEKETVSTFWSHLKEYKKEKEEENEKK